MGTKVNWIIIGAALSGLLFTGNTVLGEDAVLRAAGCKTEFFLLKDLADEYNATTKDSHKLLPAGTGNKKAVELLLEQKVDFAFTCKPIAKLQKGLQLNPADVADWKSVAIAWDPIVVVTNPQNGVTGLTTVQLTQLFAGKISNWKEIGGNDLPVLTSYINPQLESGVLLLFKEFTVGNDGQLDPNARTAEGPSMLGNYVSMTPGAVTFMGLNSYKEKYGNIVEIDGVSPTRDNILSGAYPLAATYYITTDGRKNTEVEAFLDFTSSAAGKQAINKNFISVAK